MSELEIHLVRDLGCSPERAFDHWLSPAARERWYAPDPGWRASATSDLVVGGTWSVRFGPSPDRMYSAEGRYLEIDRPHRVTYTSRISGPDGESFETTVAVVFEPTRGGTRMTFVDSGYPDPTTRDTYARGWPDFLDAFEASLRRSA